MTLPFLKDINFDLEKLSQVAILCTSHLIQNPSAYKVLFSEEGKNQGHALLLMFLSVCPWDVNTRNLPNSTYFLPRYDWASPISHPSLCTHAPAMCLRAPSSSPYPEILAFPAHLGGVDPDPCLDWIIPSIHARSWVALGRLWRLTWSSHGAHRMRSHQAACLCELLR